MNIPGPVMSPVSPGNRNTRRATEDEVAVVEDEPRPGSIDFDRVVVQIVRDPHEDLTGEEPSPTQRFSSGLPRYARLERGLRPL